MLLKTVGFSPTVLFGCSVIILSIGWFVFFYVWGDHTVDEQIHINTTLGWNRCQTTFFFFLRIIFVGGSRESSMRYYEYIYIYTHSSLYTCIYIYDIYTYIICISIYIYIKVKAADQEGRKAGRKQRRNEDAASVGPIWA